MTVSELAKAAGVTVETVRYYQRIGLLQAPKRPPHGFRRYDPQDVRRLRFVRRGQNLGFTLGEISLLLQLTSGDCSDVARLAEGRLASVRAKIADLRRLKKALERTVRDCEQHRPQTGCPLIEALLAEA